MQIVKEELQDGQAGIWESSYAFNALEFIERWERE